MPSSRNENFRIQSLQLLDAFLVWLGFWLGWEIREWIIGVEDASRDTIFWMLYIAVPFTPLVLEYFGFYAHIRTRNFGSSFFQLLKGMLVILLFIGIFSIFAQISDTRRLSLANGLTLTFVLILLRDRITAMRLRNPSRNSAHRERIVIAGTGGEMQGLLDELGPEVTGGWDVVELFDLEQDDVERLFALLKGKSVSRVVFSARQTAFEKVARAVEACELQGVEAWISASFIRTQIARPVFDGLGEKPMLVLRSTPDLSWELMCKDIIDRVGAALIILVSSPLWLVAYLGIRSQSPGHPVFFSQMRAGRYGRPFRMWKFRTMCPDAEQRLNEVKATRGNQMEGPVFKLDDDPRIFSFGAFLRKWSIDELPQLLNVLKGDMSLVGPRPLPLYEVEAFAEFSHRRRLSVKPGITCLWQAGGRNRITSFEEWVELDLRYIDTWSLWLDFKILLKTIPAVLFARGAK
jgi:exopolysaccharide biosynthesis polyprenyl glycosylphosphotransferase